MTTIWRTSVRPKASQNDFPSLSNPLLPCLRHWRDGEMLVLGSRLAVAGRGMKRRMLWADGMLDAFERVGWGALLIGADGNVIDLNDEADRHVGRDITLSKGHIATTDRFANAELQRLTAAALAGENEPPRNPRGAILLPRPDARPLMAYVIPIAGPVDDSARSARAIVVLVDLDKQREPTESILRDAFGLTPAETRIAIGFARGRDLQEIADEQKVSIGTVRKHFKAVLAKTNTNRQAELAILLARVAQQPHVHPAVPAALD